MIVKNSNLPVRKCHKCYRRTVRSFIQDLPVKKMKIDFVKFSPTVIAPTQGTDDSPGFDLYCVEDFLIPTTSIKLVRTDIRFKIPRGYFGKIYARSSFVIRHTDVGGGAIDADYCGPVSAIVFVHSDKYISLERGSRFVQIVFHKLANKTKLNEIENFDSSLTEKAQRGFGSTGLKNVCRKILTNKYIPEVVPLDLPRHENDGLLTYCDQMKYKNFLDDTDTYIKNAQIINFDMIHSQYRGQQRKNSDKHYQTVWAKDVKKTSQKKKKKVVGACLRSPRKDIFVEKSVAFSHSVGNKE